MRSTFKVFFYLRKNAKNPDDPASLYVRVTLDGESTAFSAKAEIDPKLWSQQKQNAIGRTDDAVSVNSKVDN